MLSLEYTGKALDKSMIKEMVGERIMTFYHYEEVQHLVNWCLLLLY